ncbi:hypothetical protein [Hymenobacter glacieicola]|uniref:Uncharacterized protein n=1 Tax=Hymenobacter glacieicola TaxID=1562124 RepID=A0ABQ1X4Z8_9BACT|nr:hypothetical protein [Hymenobacter glacieicola]GGG60243.1 hypothetical protein GCM10011378_40270 [Hymenobacter glacieicola]
MRTILIHWLALPAVLLSCGHASTSPPDAVKPGAETPESTEGGDRQQRVAVPKTPYTDTWYEYADSTGKRVIIENSLPKGGLRYTAPDGREYVYAVFWTRIVNETAAPVHVSIAVPADSFNLADAPPPPFKWSTEAPAALQQQPALPDNYFKLILPAEEMTLDKLPLFNYGLRDLKAVVDSQRQPSSLQRTVQPKATRFFYVIVLSKRGVEGVIRAGFRVKDDKLYYRVNGTDIYCGHASMKHVTRQQ